jgi:hypothetical protein
MLDPRSNGGSRNKILENRIKVHYCRNIAEYEISQSYKWRATIRTTRVLFLAGEFILLYVLLMKSLVLATCRTLTTSDLSMGRCGQYVPTFCVGLACVPWQGHLLCPASVMG